MGEQDTQLHEISDARERLGELADELARRAEPGRLKAMASEKATELKGQAKERAVEKADELKTRAKEAVMRKSTDVKERADTPTGWSMIGAILGAGVGSMLMKKAFDARRRSEYDTYDSGALYVESDELVPAPEGGLMRPQSRTDELKSRASETASSVKESVRSKAYELKDRASGLVDEARSRTSEYRSDSGGGGHLKQRAKDQLSTMEDQPVLIALGGIALGMLAATFIPETRRERQLMQPAKRKVRDSISQASSQLGEKLEEKLSGSTEHEEEEEEFQSSAASPSEQQRGEVPPLPPLDDYSRIH